MTGQCKLCRTQDVELRESHGIPAAIYRAMRGDTRVGNPNPWILDSRRQVQTSNQETAQILCGACEQRFADNGETWVFRNGWKADGSFPLDTLLDRERAKALADADGRVYFATHIPGVNVPAIAYFAASIFWRASVHTWRDAFLTQVRLGPYEEEFRRYLIGDADFPDHAALSFTVRESSSLMGLCHTPTPARVDGCRIHKFTMPGMHFVIWVGREIPEFMRRVCFVRGTGSPLLVTSILEPGLAEGTTAALRCSSR